MRCEMEDKMDDQKEKVVEWILTSYYQ
jgi:hypothetical protein